MKTLDPINFCPAAACAREVARFEALIDVVARLKQDAAPLSGCAPLLRGLDVIHEDLLLAADDARDRLSHADPVSAPGAIAQLLAAIHDIRVGDDAERLRAKDLEARAVRFLGAAQLFDPGYCSKLSQTKPGNRLTKPGPSPTQGVRHSN